MISPDPLQSIKAEIVDAINRLSERYNLNEQAEQSLLRWVRDYDKSLRRIRSLSQNKKRVALHQEIHHLFQRKHVKCAAAVRVWAKMGRKKSRLQVESLLDLIGYIEQLSIDTLPEIPIREVIKDGRYMCDFGWQHRAFQLVLIDILMVCGIVNEFEFCRKGRGSDSAVKFMHRKILEGYYYWVIFDFAKFYPSVKPENLTWLNLPSKVIKNVVFPNREGSLYSDKGHVTKATRQGLPQGAALSGIIASALIGRMYTSLIPGDFSRGSYVDDGGIGTCTPAEAEDVMNSLIQWQSQQAGSLTFKHISVRSAFEGIPFLGYKSSIEHKDGEQIIHCHPTFKRYQKLKERLRKKLGKCNSDIEKEECLKKAREKFIESAKLWTIKSGSLELLDITLDEILDDYEKNCKPPPKALFKCVGSHQKILEKTGEED